MLNKNNKTENISYFITGYIASFIVILIFFLYNQNGSINDLEIINENKKREVSLIMTLPEQIESQQYDCNFMETLTPYEEQMQCNEILKLNIGQTKNGEFYLGVQKKSNMLEDN